MVDYGNSLLVLRCFELRANLIEKACVLVFSGAQHPTPVYCITIWRHNEQGQFIPGLDLKMTEVSPEEGYCGDGNWGQSGVGKERGAAFEMRSQVAGTAPSAWLTFRRELISAGIKPAGRAPLFHTF